MSYETLAASIDALAAINIQLVDTVAEAQELATAAADRAVSTVDAAQLSAGIFADTATGLAATTSGKYFSVPGAATSEYLILYKNNAGAALEVKRYPSVKGIAQLQLSSGSVAFTTAGSALTGATAITESGKYVGFAIPIGSTGHSSYITAVAPFDTTMLGKLVGSEVEITVQYEASAGFLATYPITPKIRGGRPGTYVDMTPTSSALDQNGTVLTLRMRYTVSAADTYLQVIYQVISVGSPALVAASIKVKTMVYAVTAFTDQLVTPNDFMFDQRVAPFTGAIAAAQASADSATLSTGNIFSSLALSGEVFAGATFIAAADGRASGGLKIPTGSTGASAYQTALTPVSSLVGCKLKFTLVYNTTANFLSETPLSSTMMRVSRATGYVGTVPADLTRTQVGTVLTVTMSYTVLDGDLSAGALLQVAVASAATDHDRTIELVQFSYGIVSVPAGSKSGADLVMSQILASQRALTLADVQAGIAPARLTSGDLAATTVTTGQMFNGGQYITSSGAIVGMLIPTGVTAATSFIASAVPLGAATLAKMVGATIRIVTSYDTTANFLAETPRSTVTLQVVRAGSSVNVAPASIAVTQVGTVLTTVTTYVVTAADTSIKPVYQVVSTSGSQTHDRTITLKSVTYSIDSMPSGAISSAEDLLLAAQLQVIKDSIPNSSLIQIKVGPTGTYATPKLAMAAILDASASKQYELLIDTSVIYDQDKDWSVKDYVHMTADGPGYAHIHYENPDNVLPATIPATQTFWMNTTSTLTRLKVTGRNVRYPIHSDSSGANKGRVQQLKQCWIEHLGNSGAQAYQDSISSGVTVWSSLHAWGCGTSSAMVIEAEGSTFRSPSSAFYFHTRELFAKGDRVSLRNCRMLATNDTGAAVTIQPLGSCQGDLLELTGCEIGGLMSYQASPWVPDTLVNQPANHSEVRVVGSGCSPFVFNIIDFGRALKIESTDVTSASKIEVSGDAVATIFGQRVYSFPGTVGIKGYVYGWADISGAGVGLSGNVFITSLGQRLGDCSSVNKILNVKVNGGSTTVITFNQNYTAQSNTTILAAINAALGSSAVASAYNVGARFRPEMVDEERSFKNNSSEGILMGMALAYDGHNKKVRKMTSADASSLFAGIAWEDIYPGEFGRVKINGHLPNSDLYGTPGGMTYSQVLYVDPAVPGRLTLTVGTNPIMRAINAGAVEVNKK